jgi:transposase-like protein
MLDLQQEVSRMPWREVTRISLREEFVKLATQAGTNRRELCRYFGNAPKTGYKWLQRYAAEAAAGWKIARAGRDACPSRNRRRDRAARDRLAPRGARLLAVKGGPELAPSTITGILDEEGKGISLDLM